jgi:hypothetical protein
MTTEQKYSQIDLSSLHEKVFYKAAQIGKHEQL